MRASIPEGASLLVKRYLPARAMLEARLSLGGVEKMSYAEAALMIGRNLGSKSGYRTQHPNNEVYFNANVFTKDGRKIWWGDLDLTLDTAFLQSLADDCNEPVYVLAERDGRFLNEITPPLDRAVRKICPVSPTP